MTDRTTQFQRNLYAIAVPGASSFSRIIAGLHAAGDYVDARSLIRNAGDEP